jgi:hypothetical protein
VALPRALSSLPSPARLRREAVASGGLWVLCARASGQ